MQPQSQLSTASVISLAVRRAGGTTALLQFDRSPVLIGRSTRADLTLDDVEVSRRHAELLCDSLGLWSIRDMGSVNGLSINGRGTPTGVLAAGDVVQIGGYELQVQRIEASRSLEAPGRSRMTSDLTMAGTLAEVDNYEIARLGDLGAPSLKAEQLRAVMGLGRRLLTIDSESDRLSVLCETMLSDVFGAHSAQAVQIQSGQLDAPMLLCPPAADRFAAKEVVQLSSSVLRACLTSGEAVLAGNSGVQASDVNLTLAPEVMQLAVVACPLSAPERAGGASVRQGLDLLYVVLPGRFGTAEWLSLVALAVEQYQQSQLAVAVRRAAQQEASVLRELEMAKRIQRQLVPSLPTARGLELAIGFEPARSVGGDYVDVLELPDGRCLLMIADVAGKGVQAALVAASLHSMTHASMSRSDGLAELLTRMNEYLCRFLPSDSFVTLAAAIVCPRSGRVECIRAGHPQPLVVSGRDQGRKLNSFDSFPLGIDTVRFGCGEDILAPGQMLAMYTDGLTELHSADGGMLGEALLDSILCELGSEPDEPLTQTAARLKTRLDDFAQGAEPGDDRTFLLARRPVGQ